MRNHRLIFRRDLINTQSLIRVFFRAIRRRSPGHSGPFPFTAAKKEYFTMAARCSIQFRAELRSDNIIPARCSVVSAGNAADQRIRPSSAREQHSLHISPWSIFRSALAGIPLHGLHNKFYHTRMFLNSICNYILFSWVTKQFFSDFSYGYVDLL